MRIVHGGLPYLSVPAPRGGANEKIIYQLARVQAREHEVHILSIGSESRERTSDNIHIHYLPLTKDSLGAEYLFYAQMANRARQLNADVLHLHASSLAALILKIYPGRRIPVVASINYPYIRPSLGVGRIGWAVDELIARLSLKQVNRFGFISEYSFRLFRHRYGNVNGRAAVIPVGVDLERYTPDSALRARTRAGLGLAGKKAILFVGRICEQKGVHVLVDAFERLALNDPTFILLLVGPTGSTFHGSMDSTFALSIVERVQKLGGKYLGAPDEGKLVSIMNAADVLVLPSLRLEMFGMVLIEAMACGRAVVASDQGGIPEVIGDTPAGRLIPPGDASALSSILREIFATGLPDPSVPRARALAFDWKEIAAKYQVEYERAWQSA